MGAIAPGPEQVRDARAIDIAVVLLAFVPNACLRLAAAAIAVIPEECVWWSWPELLPASLRTVEFSRWPG